MRKLSFLVFILMLGALPAATATAFASNLNTTSTLSDEGIEPSDTPPPNTILDGIPLMDGLQIPSDKDLLEVLPESVSGPVIAVGIVDVDDVYNFYKRELPTMGWRPTSGRDYDRNNKMLHINAHADGKETTVTFEESGS